MHRHFPRILVVLSILASGLAFAPHVDLPAERFSWHLYADAYEPSPAPSPVQVSIQDFVFTPGTILIPAGTTVRWTNNDSVSHTVTSRSGLFDSGSLASDEVFEYRFDVPGTYSYFCSIHPSMQDGTIIVANQVTNIYLPIVMK